MFLARKYIKDYTFAALQIPRFYFF